TDSMMKFKFATRNLSRSYNYNSSNCLLKIYAYPGNESKYHKNECLENSHDCDINAICTNTEGSFNCSCKNGYRGNGTSCKVLVIFNFHSCRIVIVVDAESFLNCIILVYEFKIHINECLENTHDCDKNTTCTNTEGSFNCSCKNGYRGNGTLCKDKNECLENSHDCDINAICTNTEGYFNCSCKNGYRGNGTSCK
ncbi:neurogenic locus notch homolog 1-like, partial, partial [Paramuricea clavata]